MNDEKPFSIRGRVESFIHAFRGLFDILRTEHNAWIHGAATVVTFTIAWQLHLDRTGFCLIILAVAGVWAAEAFNTVAEVLVDMVSPARSPLAKRAKDIGAAAVLIAAIGAAVVGVVVMGPPFLERLSQFFPS